MLRKTIHLVALGVIGLGSLVATGCASSSDAGGKPYGLTSNATTSASDAARYTDSKGKYHPEWKNGINTPTGVRASADVR